MRIGIFLILLVVVLFSGCENKLKESPPVDKEEALTKDVSPNSKVTNVQTAPKSSLDKSSILSDGDNKVKGGKSSETVEKDVNWPPDTKVSGQLNWGVEANNKSSEAPDFSEGFGAHGTEKHRIVDYEYIKE